MVVNVHCSHALHLMHRIYSVQLGIILNHPLTYTHKFSPTGVAGIVGLKNKTLLNGSSKDLVFTLLEYNA